MDPISSGIKAVGGLITGGIGAVDAAISRQWQTREREASQRYNTSERVASQKYNTSERMASQLYQTDEREAQNQYSEDMYNRYQSPAALARQYQQAGLNPRLAMNNSGVGNASAASGSNGGAPSGSAPSGTHVSTPSAPMGFGQGFQDIAGALASLAQAKKAGVETMRLEKFVDKELRKFDLDADAQDLANHILKVDLNVKEQTALKTAFAVISDINSSVDKKQKEIDKLVHEGLLAKEVAETYKERFSKEMENLESDTNLKNEQADTEQTKQSLNRTNERNERLYRPRLLSSEAWKAEEDAMLSRARERNESVIATISEATSDAQLNSAFLSCEAQAKEYIALAKEAEVRGDLAQAQAYSDLAASFIGSVVSTAVGVGAAAKAIETFGRLGKSVPVIKGFSK